MRAIGLDVHQSFCEVAICDAGEVRSAGRILTDRLGVKPVVPTGRRPDPLTTAVRS